MKSGELHIIIIWSKAIYIKDNIIEDLSELFDILEVYEITWDKEYFTKNLSRFYGEKLPVPHLYKRWYSGNFYQRTSYKERQVGNGPFTLIIIRDNYPIFEQRNTNKGSSRVNINIFDAKEKYRKWTGGGHLIHTTNDIRESRHDLALLFGKTYEYLIQELKNNWDGEMKYLKQNIVGYDGWNDLNQLLIILNETVNYVVLRNFVGFPESYVSSEHGDIDILTDKYNEIIYVSNAIPVFHSKYRVHYYVNIGEEQIYFDFRFIGDNYYDSNWETSIISNRQLIRGFYIPCEEDHFYSLLYHGLIHKKELALDYMTKLADMSKNSPQPILIESKTETKTLTKRLIKFVNQKKYKITVPDDLSVYFNPHIDTEIKIPLRRIIYYSYLSIKNKLRLSYYSPLRKVLVDYYSRRIENIKSIKWYFLNYNKFKIFLKNEYKLHKFSIYQFLKWHNGAYYLRAKTDEGLMSKNVFIKTDFFFGLLRNEVSIVDYFDSKKLKYDFLPRIMYHKKTTVVDYIIYCFLDGFTLDKIEIKRYSSFQKKKIYDILLYIVKELQENSIIHRDIRPQNIFIEYEIKMVYLIDFSFAICIKNNIDLLELPFEGINKKILQTLGEEYTAGEYLWDDAYSMKKIFQEFKNLGEEVDEYINELSSLEGKLVYQL